MSKPADDPVKLMEEAEGATPPAGSDAADGTPAMPQEPQEPPPEAPKPRIPQVKYLAFESCAACAENGCGCGRVFLVLSREPGGVSPIAEAVLKPDMAERLVLELARLAPLSGATLEGLAVELFDLAGLAREREEALRVATRH